MERRCPRNTKRSNPDSVPAILSWCLAINSCMGVFLRIVVGLGTTCNDTQTGNARNASAQPARVGFKGLQRRVCASAKAGLLTADSLKAYDSVWLRLCRAVLKRVATVQLDRLEVTRRDGHRAHP